jgi:ribosomal protein S18 acetylase RimI-like enzyme
MSPAISRTRLRHATMEDEAFIIQMTERLGEIPLPPWRTRDEVARSDHGLIRDALRNNPPDSLLRIAEDAQGRRIGYTFVTTRVDYFTHEPHAYLENLALIPEAEGHGVARVLMDDAEAWARSRSYRRIVLSVFATNQRAIGLYQHLGYRAELVRYLKEL